MNLVDSVPAIALSPRGPLSESILRHLEGRVVNGNTDHELLARQAVKRATTVIHDDDIQLALFFLYSSSYGSIEQFSPDLEWNAALIKTRGVLEQAFEGELRERVPLPQLPTPSADAVARALFALTAEKPGPSLSRYFAKYATLEHAHEFLVQRSIYTLREADPHSWAIPRLRGRPKAALVEIQSDEYGGGYHDRVHAEMFAASMRAAGLNDSYAAYLDEVPAITLASQNMMSMFGINRRLIGAIVGHLAAFEMISSIPNRMYGDGLRRLGFGEDVTDYFDEHVEADAVHEQIAGHDLAGALAEDRPALLPDIMFGAAACLTVDGEVANHMLSNWSSGRSSLRKGAIGE